MNTRQDELFDENEHTIVDKNLFLLEEEEEEEDEEQFENYDEEEMSMTFSFRQKIDVVQQKEPVSDEQFLKQVAKDFRTPLKNIQPLEHSPVQVYIEEDHQENLNESINFSEGKSILTGSPMLSVPPSASKKRKLEEDSIFSGSKYLEIIHEKDAEILHLKSTIAELENITFEYDQQCTKLSTDLELAEQEQQNLKKQIEIHQQQLIRRETLQPLPQNISNTQIEDKQSLERIQKLIQERDTLSQKVSQLQNEIQKLEEKESNWNNELRTKETEFESIKKQNEMLEKEFLLCNKKLEEQMNQNSALKNKLDQKEQVYTLEKEKWTQQIQELQSNEILLENKHLKDELKTLKVIETKSNQISKENEELKKKMANIEILNEKVSTLEQTAKHLSEERDALFEKQIQFQHSWQKFFDKKTVEEVLAFQSSLQTMNINLKMEESKVKAENEMIHSKLTQLELRVKALDEEVVVLKEEKRIALEKATVKEAELHSIVNENQRLLVLLDTYAKEKSVQQGDMESLQRINELETMIKERDEALKRLRDNMEILNTQFTEQSKEEVKLKNQLLNLEQKLKEDLEKKQIEVSNWRKKSEELEKDILQLETKLMNGFGDYNNSQKVLHMKFNPEVHTRAENAYQKPTIENLKALNKVLEEKIKSLEQQLQQTDKLGSVQELKAKLDENEKLRERLKEVFRIQINDFRKIVYLLFGYRIDAITENQYRLSSMYAEAEDDNLIFKYEDKKLKLLETHFTVSKLSEKVDVLAYLKTFEAIPPFLASLCLDLFNSQTIVRKLQ